MGFKLRLEALKCDATSLERLYTLARPPETPNGQGAEVRPLVLEDRLRLNSDSSMCRVCQGNRLRHTELMLDDHDDLRFIVGYGRFIDLRVFMMFV